MPILASFRYSSFVNFFDNLFEGMGLGRSWDTFLGVGTPAAAASVKDYLKSVPKEQAQAKLVTRQAKPIFISKVRDIA